MSVDATQLERYLLLLESADDTISRENAAALRETAEQLVETAQDVAHKVSGFMALSIHQLGPFALGGGILESQITSAASYTDIEVRKGGDHDWPQRTLDANAAALDALGARTERIVAAALGDRSG